MTRTAEFRLIMRAVALLCALAAASAVWPVIDVVMTAGLLGALALGVASYWGRELVRELRFRADMRALDDRDRGRSTGPVRAAADDRWGGRG